jgi:foldase protein PrsA
MKKVIEKTEVKKDDCTDCCCENNKKKLIYIHAGILVLILAAAAFGYYKYGIVAVANGRQISRIDYIKSMEKQGGKQVLEGMVEEALIMNEAQKKGVTIDQSVIDAEIKKIEDQLKTQGQTLDAALAAQGMTKDDLIKQIKLQKTVEKLANPPTEVTQAQIDEFITKNKNQFPKTDTKEQMEATAKTQLLTQAKSEAMTKWFDELKKAAAIIYR